MSGTRFCPLPLNPRWTFEARYADYTSGNVAGFAGRSKVWLTVQLKI